MKSRNGSNMRGKNDSVLFFYQIILRCLSSLLNREAMVNNQTCVKQEENEAKSYQSTSLHFY